MTDESIAEDLGVDEPAETEEVEAELEAQEVVENDDDETEETEEPEEIEFDFFGNKKKLPRGAVPDDLALEIQTYAKDFEADYTRKTQTLAEERKQVEAAKSVADKLTALSGETLENFSTGLRIKAELEQLGQIDAQALWQSNPDQARQLSDMISTKQAELQQVQSTVANKEMELSQAQQADTVRRAEEGKQAVLRQAADFDADAVVDYVTKAGIPKADAENWALSPAVAILAHKAMKFDAMQARAKKPTKPAAKPVTALKPVSKGTGGKRTSSEPSDSDSIEEWTRKRNKQLARKQA